MTIAIDDKVIVIEVINKKEKEKKLKNLPIKTKNTNKVNINEYLEKRIKDNDYVNNLKIVFNNDEDEEEDKDKEIKDFIVNDNNKEKDDNEDDDNEDNKEEEEEDEDDKKIEDYISNNK
ncbi:hypothetical protein B7463_g9490, partial [Scytalidium lignicola]